MFFIIGKYIEHDYNVAAVKVYDTETKEYGLYRKQNVLKQVETNNISVAGVSIRVTGETYLSVNRYYNTKMLDLLDDIGNPISKKAKVVIATKGFGKSAKITVVDSEGIEENINYDELVTCIKKKEIVGACYVDSRYVAYNKWCKRESLNMKDLMAIAQNRSRYTNNFWR